MRPGHQLDPSRSTHPGSVDPELLSGSGVRPSDWTVGASVEQQILPRASVEVGYFRRWFDGFTVVDNLLVGDADFAQTNFHRTDESESAEWWRSDASARSTFKIRHRSSGFNQVTAPTDRYGNQYQRSDSVDVVFNGRTSFGLTLQGGSSTTRTVRDSCEIRRGRS